MRDLDDTDLEILRLLAADARRPFREIADRVDLSPPAVSDRVDRLREQGVLQGFTIDVDRERLGADGRVLVELEPRPAAVDAVAAAATDLEGVETVLEGADGRVLVHAARSPTEVRPWLAAAVDLEALRGYDVTPLDRARRVDGIPTSGFALECAVCGKAIDDDGITRTVDGDLVTVCCPSCEERYVSEYERRRDALEN